VDFNWYLISALKAIGLVWDVKLPKLREARIQPIASPAPRVEKELVEA